ncbi:hypothetical protein EVAR_40180_1 [Eumeta japonica]|uniref:Uncharacterized protein n=1 Tax=Eumeta variegata TaxID=151549 RepID=A0A4C1XNY2_EUMVA|nr:hypothetical protein EVAR_40180_1 [Eumeta japonica]
MRGREPQRSLRYDCELVYRAHVTLIREICERNSCIRRSCSPAATRDARAAIIKSEHRNAVHHFAHTPRESVLRDDCEENPKCGLTRQC